MLTIKNIFYKNFLSTGNNGISVDFLSHNKTLVVGTNGQGKSTMIDALFFCLYGKPFRNIKKPELINSINEKDMLVELEFEVNGHEYKVLRGIKPNVFEIYKDGEFIHQDASVKDYQKVLESIIGMNERTFKQIVILGSSSYVPFMKLTTGDRRAVIENLLDIQVFSYMNQLVKGYLSENNDRLKEIDSELKIKENSVELKQDHLEEMVGKRDEYVKQNDEKINELLEFNKRYDSKLDKLDEEIKNLYKKIENAEENRNKISKLEQYVQKLESNKKEDNKQFQFYTENDVCPNCEQDLAEEFVQEQIDGLKTKIETWDDYIAKTKQKLEQEKQKYGEIKGEEELYNQTKSKYKEIEGFKSSNESYIQRLREHNQQMMQEDHDSIRKEISDLSEEIAELKENKEEVEQNVIHYQKLTEMLKDEGIKSQIIKNYIPILNRLIRKFLDTIEFNVDFQFEENFNEIIKYRGRDEFTYSQLSEGEKLRIDIVLLFSFKELAKIKNSAATNLLIIDELGGSSLDEAGMASMNTILEEVVHEGGTQVMFIGHNVHQFKDNFDRILEFEKPHTHTVINEHPL